MRDLNSIHERSGKRTTLKIIWGMLWWRKRSVNEFIRSNEVNKTVCTDRRDEDTIIDIDELEEEKLEIV